MTLLLLIKFQKKVNDLKLLFNITQVLSLEAYKITLHNNMNIPVESGSRGSDVEVCETVELVQFCVVLLQRKTARGPFLPQE